MTAFGESNFLQALGWAVLNSLWQMALLWVIYQLIAGIIRPSGSSAKSTLAATLLITGFGWFIFTFASILSDNVSSHGSVATGFLETTGNEQLNNWLHTTLPLASCIYLVLLILPLLHFAKNYRYVQLIRRHGLSKIDVDWKIFVQKVSAQMGIRKKVNIWVSEFVSSPVTIGYLKPVILVPLAAINHLTAEQLEAVLLHELSHIRRFDYLINLITRFIKSVLYFNPFVNAFMKTIEREREKSCDEMVMQFQYDPHGYASALLMLEKASLQPATLVVPAAHGKNELLKRIEIILGIDKKPVVSFNRLAGLLAGLLCFIGLNAVLILSKPVKGDRAIAFNSLTSSPYIFMEDNPAPPQEIGTSTVSNHLPEAITRSARTKYKMPVHPPVTVRAFTPPARDANGFMNVSLRQSVIAIAPELKQYQKNQVKQAVEASKKLIEDAQWKATEKSLADVFTQEEKDVLKSQYLKEVEKFDWKKWETRLDLAYNQVDWDRINSQLGSAMTRMRLDSLQKVYTVAARQLDKVQKQLSDLDMKGIPDTEITIEKVEEKRQQVYKLLHRINAVKTKKIIHL